MHSSVIIVEKWYENSHFESQCRFLLQTILFICDSV